MLRLLWEVKKWRPSQRTAFKEVVHCLTQNCAFLEGKPDDFEAKFRERETVIPVLPLDGHPSEMQEARVRDYLPPYLRKLPAREVVFLAGLVDPSKSAADIFLDYNLDLPAPPAPQVNWAYGLKEFGPVPVAICPKTMRPFFTVAGAPWEEAARAVFGIAPRKMLPRHKYYAAFLLKYQRKPSKEEFLLFLYNRVVAAGKMKTLPFLAELWADQVLRDFEAVLAPKDAEPVTVQEALKLMLESNPIEKRKLIEAAP